MQLDLKEVEELSKTLYIRALKLLPNDIKQGFERLMREETNKTGKTILGTMVENIAVAERTKNLLCQDTGIPIYNVTIGRHVEFDGAAMKEAIRRGCERATKEHPLRSSVVHPITRVNEQTSCGIGVPIINVDFDERDETVEIEMIPKGSGSENGSFLQMLIPADGVAAVKRFVIDKVIECGGRVCPPTIVGVGIGGTSDVCMHLAKVAATRPARHHLFRCGRRQDRGAVERGGQRTRHRPARPGRTRDRVPRACGSRRHPHHHEPRGGEHPMPFRAPGQRHHHARRHRLRVAAHDSLRDRDADHRRASARAEGG